jgi:hypothetical protein
MDRIEIALQKSRGQKEPVGAAQVSSPAPAAIAKVPDPPAAVITSPVQPQPPIVALFRRIRRVRQK